MRRRLTIFLCAAGGALALAIFKALATNGLGAMPPVKVLLFAASMFGLLCVLVDFALFGQQRKSEPSESVIVKARRRPIVFFEICPPPATPGLSFYGGAPVGPATLEWPRGSGGVPLPFLMQWDCTALALQDATGLLPRSGALYLFADLTGSDAEAFRFVHAAGPAKDWRSLQVPAKLLLPQWPFTPLAFQLPAGEDDRFWNEGEGVGEALLRLQHPQGVPPAKHLSKTKAPFGRPFPEFPHDYAAIRIVTAKVLRQLEHPVTRALREASASVPAWREEATRRAALAAAQRPEARVDPALSDEMWHWMEGLEPVLRLGWDSVVDECVEASLGMGSEARSVLPQERLAACAERHQLASAYLHEEYPDRRSPEALAAYEKRKAEGLLREVRTIHAPCPNHMFGPPSFVQGYVEDYLDTWVLLLELSSREPLGHEFGEGVFQFMIQPADLRDGRFDKTKLVASAY